MIGSFHIAARLSVECGTPPATCVIKYAPRRIQFLPQFRFQAIFCYPNLDILNSRHSISHLLQHNVEVFEMLLEHVSRKSSQI